MSIFFEIVFGVFFTLVLALAGYVLTACTRNFVDKIRPNGRRH